MDFEATRRLFHLPEGITYLDGNSLGPLPLAAEARLAEVTKDQWGEMLITGWNRAGWMAQPRALGARIARLIGAREDLVVVGDTLSLKITQCLAAALAMNPDRKVILSDTGNFPTDLYMAEGLIRTLDRGHRLELAAPEDLLTRIDESVAVLLVTEVDYRTGRRHDVTALCRRAHEFGALVVLDLAHSAGALDVDVTASGADFAAGCTYKFLNGGPGAPAFVYVRADHVEMVAPILPGWLGHAAPFAFAQSYEPGAGIERFRIGTPPVLQMAALSAALDVFDAVDMAELRKRSLALSDLFIDEVERSCPMLELATPRAHRERGSQVSFRHNEGYAIMQALIAEGVIGDFRAPDILRFGITPLYLGEADIRHAAGVLARVMADRLWDRPEFKRRQAVT